jgi:serine/threonine-protein kinase
MGGDAEDLVLGGGAETERPTGDRWFWFWFSWPQLLPENNAVLATVGTPSGPRIAVISLQDPEVTILATLGQAMGAQYLPTGDLLYSQAGVLYAVPFDVASSEPRGTAVPLLDGIASAPGGNAAYATVSSTGVLAYAPSRANDAQLVWVDRQANVTPLAPTRADFHAPRLSPDGRQLVVTEVEEGRFRIWLHHFERGQHTPLASGLQANDAIWTPDGSRITFSGMPDTARVADVMGVVWTAVDGTGGVETLVQREGVNAFPHSWSPESAALAFYFISPETARDIWILPQGGEPQPFLVTGYNERTPTFSPDGRWIAYTSDESGQDEVYVTAYPGPRDTRLVSRNGGRTPVWLPDGRELFYRDGNRMMSVPVRLEPTFASGEPRELFRGNFYAEPDGSGTQDYDVSPDGQRFVMIQTEPMTQIRMVMNWFEELREAKEQ